MKKTFIAFALVFGFQLSADDHLPANYSMYQANFLFNCPVAEKCFAAFDKYMNSPEVAKENSGQLSVPHKMHWHFYLV